MTHFLEYFVGKVCSVQTCQTNWTLNKTEVTAYFVGYVEEVSSYGITLVSVINGKKTFIMMASVVAVAEESVIEGEKEDLERSAKEYQEKKQEIFKHNPNLMVQTANIPTSPKKPITKVNDSPFVDLASMKSHVLAAKDKFKK